MDGERWARVDRLFDEALDRPREDRRKWLEEVCGADRDLLAAVEKLLALSETDEGLEPGGVLVGSVLEETVRAIETAEPGAFDVGDRLGAYELAEFLGKGGMGRVYAAFDPKLGRRVALKVLPPEMASLERRKRFEREAKAVAALNHPNIVHVYSIEDADGVSFITMELVVGETLAGRIPEGGLPLKEFFAIAIPLADALGAAHERGVVHRDLKPGNVMVGEDGRVKVLDFGLAKLAPDEERRDEPDPHTTQEGHILGTVSHMSPEQAEGKSTDHRTDIFALGVILYEMCTGTRPFTGETKTAILSSILKDSPVPITDRNPRLPRGLERVIQRCLRKEPERRYQTAIDVRNELEELEYELGSQKLFRPALERGGGSGQLVAAALVAAAIAAAVTYLVLDSERGPSPDLVTGTFSRLTTDPGVELFPSLSPDGGFLAYASRAPGASDWDIYLLRAGGERAINLTPGSPADDVQPAFSPDGRHIAFRSSRDSGGLFVMGATGESARRLTDFGWNPAWSPDGRKLVFATEPIALAPFDRPTKSALWTVEIESGELQLLTEGDAVQPSWSPGGHRVAFWGLARGGAQRDLYTVPASGGEALPLIEDAPVDWNPVWSPDGRHLYFSSDRGGSMNLWRVAIDEKSGLAAGAPEPVRAPAAFAAHMSFSRDATRMVYASSLTSGSLWIVELEPDRVTVRDAYALREQGILGSPRISPDGEWVVVSREGQEDLLLLRMDGSEERLLTNDPHRDRYPRWSPDGERIAFYSNRSGTYEIWSVKPDGSDLQQHTDVPERPTRYPIWSPDGRRLLFSAPGTSGYIIDPAVPWHAQTPELLPPYPSEEGDFVPLDWSPDGKWIAGYLSSRSGVRAGIAVYSLESESYETLTDFGFAPVFLPGSRKILFQGLRPGRSRDPSHYESDFRLFAVDRDTREVHEVLALPGGSIEAPAASSDGRKLVFMRTAFTSDLWMIDASPEGTSSEAPF